MKYKLMELVVGPVRMPEWIFKWNSMTRELLTQYDLKLLDINSLEKLTFGSKTENLDFEPSDLFRVISALDYALKRGIVCLPQVQLLIEHKDFLDLNLLDEKLEFPDVFLVGFDREEQESLRRMIHFRKTDFVIKNYSGTKFKEKFSVVFFNLLDKEKINYFCSSGVEKSEKSLWIGIDRFHFEKKSSLDIIDEETLKNLYKIDKFVSLQPYVSLFVENRNKNKTIELLKLLRGF